MEFKCETHDYKERYFDNIDEAVECLFKKNNFLYLYLIHEMEEVEIDFPNLLRLNNGKILNVTYGDNIFKLYLNKSNRNINNFINKQSNSNNLNIASFIATNDCDKDDYRSKDLIKILNYARKIFE